MTSKRRKANGWNAEKKNGKRSGLEAKVTQHLDRNGVAYEYEPFRMGYVQPEEVKYYLPDIIIGSIVIEVKGRFQPQDRKKMLLLKKMYPKMDIRMLFSNPRAKIGKTSKTTNADWCAKHGIPCADGRAGVPRTWLAEPINTESLAEIERAKGLKKNASE